MRGNNGMNISSPGIAVPRTQMDTIKAHILVGCELTAVFPCTISYGDFESVQKAVLLYLLYFEVQR